MKVSELLQETVSADKPMTITKALKKLLYPAVAAKLGCDPKELTHIRSEEYGTVSAKMKAQYAALDALQGKSLGNDDLPFMLYDQDEDPEDAEEVSFDIWYSVVPMYGIKFASFGLQEGGPGYTAEFLVKKSDLAILTKPKPST